MGHVVAVHDEYRARPMANERPKCTRRAEKLWLLAVSHAHTEAAPVAGNRGDVLRSVVKIDPHIAYAEFGKPSKIAFEHTLAADLDQYLRSAVNLAGETCAVTRCKEQCLGVFHRVSAGRS